LDFQQNLINSIGFENAILSEEHSGGGREQVEGRMGCVRERGREVERVGERERQPGESNSSIQFVDIPQRIEDDIGLAVVNGLHHTTQHITTQHNTTQHNTTQHNTTQTHLLLSPLYSEEVPWSPVRV
jgi:hypothetical protein